MVYYLLICRSLTYAQRTAKALEHAGITAILTKVPLHISPDGCGYCVQHFECPAIVMAEDESHVTIDPVLCTGCGVCRYVCPKQALRFEA